MSAARPQEKSTREIELLRDQGLRRLLVAASRNLNRSITEKLEGRGFKNTRPGHSMLLANLDLAGNSVTEVADRANMSKQSMARLAIELEEMKVITRRASSVDGRTLVLNFTARGRALVRETIAVIDELERELGREMGARKLATLKDALRVIAERR